MEDELHLGAGYEVRAALLDTLGPKISLWVRGGFKRPSEISELLNKFGFRTATGDHWSPRLVWFLQAEIAKRRQLTRALNNNNRKRDIIPL
jgi:hypothetical protein